MHGGNAHAYGGRGGRGKLMARREQVKSLANHIQNWGIPEFFLEESTWAPLSLQPTAQSMSTPSKSAPLASNLFNMYVHFSQPGRITCLGVSVKTITSLAHPRPLNIPRQRSVCPCGRGFRRL